ncbi:hypothetical protein NCCP1664_10620 [Zafaria cholistanensis]|uniref:Uncharacterized protein n=1 Tax=Zafaria cholistanensis TaxID=1682741 RepID=A0A5A7NNX8_9MICC|nr:hypothetical protein NCCP1664_10620 [Zafaria cholistanensis]
MTGGEDGPAPADPTPPGPHPPRPLPQQGFTPTDSETPVPPPRVRVTAPAGALPPPRTRAPDPAANFYVRSLVRSQLRLAVSVALGFVVVLVGMALLLALWPDIHGLRLFTVPLPWIALGIGVYPLLVVTAVLFNRAAARNEARYREIARQ